MIKNWIRYSLVFVSGYAMIQRLLEKCAHICNYLMGIGSGGAVSSSGERVIFDLLKKSVHNHYCIFDVGANKGQFLELALLNLAGKDFYIHSFEPGANAFSELEKTHSKNARVTLNHVGLGADCGDAVLHYDVSGSGLASLSKRRLNHFGIDFGMQEIVQIRSIDNYCEEHQISKIDLLKIDVEGHELDVLAGARNLLDRGCVEIVTFEFGGCNIDTRTFFQDFWYYFHEKNFEIFRITPSGYLSKISTYKETLEQFITTNFIAVKKHENE